jgi:hypothetical protein
VSLFPAAVHAQHEGHGGPEGHETPAASPEPPGHAGHETPAKAPEEILLQPLGSGTAWLPKGSPLHDHALHAMAGEWMIMTHGELVLRYNAQNFNNPDRWPRAEMSTSQPVEPSAVSTYPGLERGDAGFDAPNWAMVSAERPVGTGGGRLMLRAMMSLDPLTVGEEGYPLLFQTGEGLVDRQHPHDLFMELGALYAHPVGEHSRVFGYFGLPGEPALGPTAFMHRPSAGNNPDAPLAHHSQDATHITYGVATLGWIHRGFKADASAFNGREPDAERWDIELGAFDSYSLRLTQKLGPFSLQGSGAYLQDPEPGEHGSVIRATGSIGHNGALFGANWANTIVMGANFGHHGGTTRSLLRESALTGKRASVWGRWESLERTKEELNLPTLPDDGEFFWVHAVTVGAGARLFAVAGVETFLGGQLTVNAIEKELRDDYGRVPLSGQVFVKIRPAAALAKAGHDHP